MTDILLLAILGLFILAMWRCDILSKRIDIVHKRVSAELHINGLRCAWDEAVAEEAAETLMKRIRRRLKNRAVSSGDGGMP